LKALREIDPPQEKSLPVVLKILEEGDPAVVMAAMLTLAEEGETVVPRLCKALENEQACYWACIVLAEIGPEAKGAVPQLKAVLKHEQPETRLQAVAALGEIGPAAKPLTADIVALLENDPFGGVRYAAAFALGKIGTDAGATAALNKAVDKGDAFLKLLSAWALARNNPDDKASVKRAVDLIVQAFKSDDAGLRRAAAKAAVDFDVSLDVVAPMLIDALGDEDQTVVKNAIESLAELGPKALKHIDKLFERDELRFYPIALITRLGPEATDAVPALIEVLGIQHATDEDAMFLREIQFAVAAIGPGAKGAVRALADNLDSRNHEVVASASYALGKIGPAARAAVPALRRNLRHEKLIVKLATVRALLEILPDQRQVGPSAIPLLAQGLEHENEYVRAECATALGEIGSPARKALAALKGLLEDESEIVRKAAAEAIEKIE
jgi:HEAT repeat protein